MKTTYEQRRDADKGFTLIELMVVVLIIAILLAIAIPTFLGAQNKAKDRSAQSSARNALTNAKTIFADNGKYTDANIGALATSEPSLKFFDASAAATEVNYSDGPKSVSVLLAGDKTWYAAVLSETDTCFYIMDSVLADGGTKFGKDASSSNTTCVATATPDVGWDAKW